MGKIHLGAQLYTVREKQRISEMFLETVGRLAEIGYRYMQVSGVGPTVTPDVIAEASKPMALSAFF